MNRKRVTLHTAANDRVKIATFSRSGTWIPAVTDDAIHADFVKGEHRILAAWHNWFGYYLLANNSETDGFLGASALGEINRLVRAAHPRPRVGRLVSRSDRLLAS